jgi:hypothetical protein
MGIADRDLPGRVVDGYFGTGGALVDEQWLHKEV